MEGECAERDFVGDWLVGMCTRVGEEFSLADATADYKKMVTDFDDAGPLTRAAFMAQAYGVAASRQGSGAFRLRVHADHQGDAHVFSRTLIQYSTCACPAGAA